ncbi:MAG TPA: phage portal protein [Methylophilaceae bacterium]|nr:phage portal protein [Methylophilaceae bacterium]
MALPAWISRLLPAGKLRKRRFDAAQYNRLTSSFHQSARSINMELRGDLDALRRRSRDLAKNEPMARKFLSLVGTNVVGPIGFKLQARVKGDDGKQDTFANDAIEAAYYDWCRVGNCEVTGRMSMADLERAIMRAVARDGEALLVEKQGYPNKYGYALQLIDIERLDTSFNREASPGINAVIMGVEINNEGRALAYWLASARFGRDPSGRNLERVDAAQIIHIFLTDDPEQLRGIPWMHASMIRMHHLKGYEEAAIIAARVGASKMGFFEQPEGDSTSLTNAVGDGEDKEGIPFTEAEPAQFGAMPPGWKFHAFNPDYPHDQFPEFVKSAKRDIGSGVDVAYHSLANDLEGVNFSSIRSGTLEERDVWMIHQGWFIGVFLERIYANWLSNALLSGAILLPNGSALPAAKYRKFLAHEFQGRRWSWVDPKKDIEAAILAIDNNLASPYSIAAQQGMDAEEVLDDIARFQQAVRDRGIEAKPAAPAQPNQNNLDGDDE